MPVALQTIGLLIVSNVFMTFAWYAHLKELSHKPWIVAALLSWGVALFEYLFQVPANRIGHTQFSVGQLKILQEVITLSVFVPFSALNLREPVRLDFLWAGLCLCGAVYFVFRAPTSPREVAPPPEEVRQVAPESAPEASRSEDAEASRTD